MCAYHCLFVLYVQLREIQDARRNQREMEFQSVLEEEYNKMINSLITVQRDITEKIEMEYLEKEQDIRKRKLLMQLTSIILTLTNFNNINANLLNNFNE